MASLAQSQFLRIFDAAGVTYHRWQSYYAYRSVTWESASWIYLPFEAGGITAGQTGDESGITLTMPAVPLVLDAMHQAIALRRLLELRIYSFTPTGPDDVPQLGQTLIATFTGEVVNASASLTSLSVELGSSLSPVGAQIPPRTLTTQLIGKGCRL